MGPALVRPMAEALMSDLANTFHDRIDAASPDALRQACERVQLLEQHLRDALERIEALEAKPIDLADLPLAALVRWLENHGGLNIALAAYPGSTIKAVTRDEALARKRSGR